MQIHSKLAKHLKIIGGKMNSLFKIWLYALGSFSDKKTKPYDRQVVVVRSIWVLLHIVTCFMIIIGNGRLMGWW